MCFERSKLRYMAGLGFRQYVGIGFVLLQPVAAIFGRYPGKKKGAYHGAFGDMKRISLIGY